MLAVIFGRPGCPYCDRAKDLVEELSVKRDDFNFCYVDIQSRGITKKDLAAEAGKPEKTVPQIFCR